MEDRLLHRRRIRRRHPYTDERVRRYRQLLRTTTVIIADLPPIAGVVRDPNDDMVMACALKGQAGYVVTRDKDLLSPGAYQDIRMVTPRQLLDLLSAG